MKIIKYKFLTAEINRGTGKEPNIEQLFIDKTITCPTDCLDANEEIAKREAHNGEYTIEDDGQPEPAPSGGDSAVWDELDAAYQEGYREGVDSV